MKKLIAAAALVVVGLFAVPTAANAAGYVPASNVSVSGPVAPGAAATVGFAAGSFVANETVSISVTGEGAATIAAVQTVTATKTASANGALSFTVTLPTNARGTYSVTATGLSSGNVGTAALTVVPADAGASAIGNGTGGLAFTGSTTPTLVIWGAGGAVALGAALLAVMGLARRQRAEA